MDFTSLKVAELKEELTKRGLDTKGLKKDLLERLQGAEDEGRGTDSTATLQSDEVGVGNGMIDVDENMKEDVNKETEEVLQPAALDDEVAKVVAEEESKEAEDIIPPTKSVSPMPVEDPKSDKTEQNSVVHADIDVERDNILTPPLPTNGLPDLDEPMDEAGDGKRKREEEALVPAPSKRPRKVYNTPLPSSLSHLIHPPTATIYITNLRRPLINSSLHDYLFSNVDPSPMDTDESAQFPPPKNPFSSADTPNLWVSGIKSHAYATFPSISSALEVAGRIEGTKWPEETGDKLHVEFVDDGEVADLIRKEEEGWFNGRQKLELKIIKLDEGEGGEIYFKLDSAGGVTGGRGAPGTARAPPMPIGARAPLAGGRIIRPVPLSGTNAIMPVGAPRGPAAARGGMGNCAGAGPGMGIRGRALPPHQMRSGFRSDLLGSGGNAGGMQADRLGGNGVRKIMKRTRATPVLLWCEGPGAEVAR